MNALAQQIMSGEIELIALPEVRRITGMGTTFIYKHMAAGNFPRQRKIGKKASRWVKNEVMAWVHAQRAADSSPSR